MEVKNWWPVFSYLVPWSIYAVLHYANRERFLRDAVWCIRLKLSTQVFIFIYGPSIAIWAILTEWYSLPYATITFLLYTSLALWYLMIYLRRTRAAWEEKKTSNYRFAIDPETQTFRFDEGFNFAQVSGMWWDNLIFGALLSLSTFSGALIGDLAGDLGIGRPLIFAVSVLTVLLTTRGLIAREVVTLQKIQKYEKEHSVTIRPR